MFGIRLTLLSAAVVVVFEIRPGAGQEPQADPWVVRQLGSDRLMHDGLITRAVFSHDSSELIVADDSPRLRFWSVDDGRLARMFEHDTRLISVAASSDGQWIAVADWDHKVLLLDARTLAVQGEAADFPDHLIFALSFYPNGRRLVVGGFGGPSFHTLSVPDLKRLTTHTLPEGERLLDVAVSPDGASLWACTTVTGEALLLIPANSRLRRYELDAEAASELVLNDAGRTWSLRFADGGRSIVTVEREPESDPQDAKADSRRYLRTYDARTLARTASFPISDGTTTYEVSPQGNSLAAPDRRKRFAVWETKTGRLMHDFPSSRAALGVAFSPDGRWLAGHGVRRVSVWDLTTGALHLAGEGHDTTIRSVRFTTDGRSLLAENASEIRRWDWRTGESQPLPELPPFEMIALDLTQRILITAGDDAIQFHDAATGAVRQSVRFDGERVRELNLEPGGAGLIVETEDETTGQYSLRVFTPDASGSRWDERRHIVRSILSDALAWSPDQRAVALTTWGDGEQLWMVPLDPHVPLVTAPTRLSVRQLAFTPGCNQIVALRSDSIDVFDAASGRRVERVRVPDLWWLDVVPATGELVVVRNQDSTLAPAKGRLEVRPAPSLDPTLTCEISARVIEDVAISPDGKKFAARLLERGAETFELRGREVAIIERTADGKHVLRRASAPLSTNAMAFSPDSSFLAVAQRNGVVEIWDVARLPLDEDR